MILLGQDIAEYGGVFKVTEGFVEEFGKARVRNTPIIESGALGAALGLALDGFVPMVEMQFGDFITCGFNQIVNNLAKTHYRWGARVPVVVRVPVGGGVGAGPFHSQNVESWFTSVAGLKVVAPATPFDAKGLLLAAFEDGNPVLFLEHKLLYRSAKGPVPEGFYTVPLGRARVARTGGRRHRRDLRRRASSGPSRRPSDWRPRAKEIEVVDLRTLAPWDPGTVLASVRKTGRALVLHEAPLTGGFGGELAATIGERGLRVAGRAGRPPGRARHAGPLQQGPGAVLHAEGAARRGPGRASGLLTLGASSPLHAGRGARGAPPLPLPHRPLQARGQALGQGRARGRPRDRRRRSGAWRGDG